MSEETSNTTAAVPQEAATSTTTAPIKRERSPAVIEDPTGGGEEDAFNGPSSSPATKKPKFEKKSKKDFKPKSPYPGRGKKDDRPQLTAEEREQKAAEKDKLRAERKLADEERMGNVNDEDRRLPKRRCALMIGFVTFQWWEQAKYEAR